MTSSTLSESDFTTEDHYDIVRALGSKVTALEKNVNRAKRKHLDELSRNLEKALNRWVKLLNKAKERFDLEGDKDDLD